MDGVEHVRVEDLAAHVRDLLPASLNSDVKA
jgi:hypothetical protein